MAERRSFRQASSREPTPQHRPGITWVLEDGKPDTFYVNMAQARVSLADISLDLGQVIDSDEDTIKVNHLVRLMMSPQHAKALATIMMNQIVIYEATFGKIPESPSPEAMDVLAEAIRRSQAEAELTDRT